MLGEQRRLSAVPRTRKLRAVSDDCYPDWDAVYRDNIGWIYQLMFSKVGNRSDAEDLTTDVFLSALRPLRLTVPVAEVRAYLKATARTTLAAFWRDRMGREITAIDMDVIEADADDPVIDESTARLATEVLDTLPDNYRKILDLRFLQGYTIKDAATTLGLSISNAKVLQHRALRLAAQNRKGGMQ